MGKIQCKFWHQKETRILIFGLDAAGKTSMLYKMKLGEIVTTIPTIGFNVETLEVKSKGLNITSWDIGGRDKIRPLYRHYYQNTDAVIFVVDSSDRERLDEAFEEFGRIYSEEELKDAVFILVANKQDLPNALTPVEIESRVYKRPFGSRIKIFPVSATSGEGLFEPFEWLTDALAKRHTKNQISAKLTGEPSRSDTGKHTDEQSVTKPATWSYLKDSVLTVKKLLRGA